MKFMKHLFTVPEGEKVTDRHMKRILASSICGILLCMSCLFGTTWAWYTVTVQSNPISLQIADVYLNVSVNDVSNLGGETVVALPAGETAAVKITFAPETKPDSLNTQPKRYVVITVYDQEDTLVDTYYAAADANGEVKLNVATDEACKIYFAPAWQIPLKGTMYPTEDFKLIEKPVETTAPTTTAATEPASTEATGAAAQEETGTAAQQETGKTETTEPAEQKAE